MSRVGEDRALEPSARNGHWERSRGWASLRSPPVFGFHSPQSLCPRSRLTGACRCRAVVGGLGVWSLPVAVTLWPSCPLEVPTCRFPSPGPFPGRLESVGIGSASGSRLAGMSLAFYRGDCWGGACPKAGQSQDVGSLAQWGGRAFGIPDQRGSDQASSLLCPYCLIPSKEGCKKPGTAAPAGN